MSHRNSTEIPTTFLFLFFRKAGPALGVFLSFWVKYGSAFYDQMSGIILIFSFVFSPDLKNQYEEQNHSNYDGKKEEYNTNK